MLLVKQTPRGFWPIERHLASLCSG